MRGGQQATFDLLLGFIVEGCALVDINAVDDQQWTPLHIAAFLGNWTMTLQLIQAYAGGLCLSIDECCCDRGANVNSRTADGETPQNIAARMGYSEVSKLLTYAQTGMHPKYVDHADRKKVPLLLLASTVSHGPAAVVSRQDKPPRRRVHHQQERQQ